MEDLKEKANAGLHDYLFQLVNSKNLLPDEEAYLMDLGCGTGSWLNRFKSKGFKNLKAIDADAEQFAVKQVEHICLDFDEYDGEVWGEYGLITALEIIEHLANPGKLLELASKNLKPGGYLLLSPPNIQSLPARLRFLMKGN